MVDFVFETFSGETESTPLTDHVGEIGASWVLVPGHSHAPRVSASQENLYSYINDFQGSYASGVPTSPDYTVEADIIGGVAYPSLLARCSTTEQTYYMARFSSGGDLQLFKSVAGSNTLLAYLPGFDKSIQYKTQLIVSGTTISITVDDVEQIITTDSSITAAGRAGVRFAVRTDSVSRIDNFRAFADAGQGMINFTGAASSEASVEGTLSKKLSASGDIEAVLNIAGTTLILKKFSGEAEAFADIQGILLSQELISLSGDVSAVANIYGELSSKKNLLGSIETIAIADAALLNKLIFQGEVIAVADIVGDLAGYIDVIGGGLATVTDPTIESLTVKRLLERISTKYTIHSL